MSLSFNRFVGKVAVVTGASSGIGKAIVVRLVKEGIIVAGLARRVERIDALAVELKNEKGKLYGFKCDIQKEEEIKSAFAEIFKKLGNVHILVNNAGIIRETNLSDGDTQKWKEVLDTNVLGLCIATREAVQNMKKNSIKGHIIHINSTLGHEVLHFPAANVYGASKYAVTALTEQLRKEFNAEKLPIKITDVSPGRVVTEVDSAAGMHFGFNTENALKPEDVAEAVAYTLATPETVNVKQISLIRAGVDY